MSKSGEASADRRQTIFGAVSEERDRQMWKWGDQCHSDQTWLAILMEEVGEVSKLILDGDTPWEELKQVAAVTVAWLEDIWSTPERLHQKAQKARDRLILS